MVRTDKKTDNPKLSRCMAAHKSFRFAWRLISHSRIACRYRARGVSYDAVTLTQGLTMHRALFRIPKWSRWRRGSDFRKRHARAWTFVVLLGHTMRDCNLTSQRFRTKPPPFVRVETSADGREAEPGFSTRIFHFKRSTGRVDRDTRGCFRARCDARPAGQAGSLRADPPHESQPGRMADVAAPGLFRLRTGRAAAGRDWRPGRRSGGALHQTSGVYHRAPQFVFCRAGPEPSLAQLHHGGNRANSRTGGAGSGPRTRRFVLPAA